MPVRYAIALLLFLCIGQVDKASAALSLTDGGLGVYDDKLDVTWASDANLLGTMESQKGLVFVITSILINSPLVPDPTTNNSNWRVVPGEFGGTATNPNTLLGTADWLAAEAFIRYLNSTKYGGSNQWRLPLVGATPQGQPGTAATDGEMGELYYNEFGAPLGAGILGNPIGPKLFKNVKVASYWTGSVFASNPNNAWLYETDVGEEFPSPIHTNGGQFYLWPVTPGRLDTVPLPGAIWLLGACLLGLYRIERPGRAR